MANLILEMSDNDMNNFFINNREAFFDLLDYSTSFSLKKEDGEDFDLEFTDEESDESEEDDVIEEDEETGFENIDFEDYDDSCDDRQDLFE